MIAWTDVYVVGVDAVGDHTGNGVGLGNFLALKTFGKLFDRFFQVETHLTRRFGGMGLGLPVAKSMIKLHNGRIWVESEEGKGSTFTFLLPVDGKEKTAQSTGPYI